MSRLPIAAAVVLLLAPGAASAQSGPPNTVFLEEMTSDEVRAFIEEGGTSVIIATAGTEQKGPHMVTGEHRFVLEYTTDRIARALGDALVAPILTYVPEGDWDPKTGHMRMPGTISLPEDRFVTLLEHAARSLEAGGFTDIIFLGDSGGNQDGMRRVVETLNASWEDTGARAHFIGDYYAESRDDIREFLRNRGYTDEEIGSHAGMVDTSQLLYVDPRHVRSDERAPGGGFEDSGVTGDPTLATAELGRHLLRIKIDNALEQIRASLEDR